MLHGHACSAHVDIRCSMQVGNKLHGQRFKLQEGLKKLQDCMNLLEKEHAWQDHVEDLKDLVQQQRGVLQVWHTCCMHDLHKTAVVHAGT